MERQCINSSRSLLVLLHGLEPHMAQHLSEGLGSQSARAARQGRCLTGRRALPRRRNWRDRWTHYEGATGQTRSRTWSQVASMRSSPLPGEARRLVANLLGQIAFPLRYSERKVLLFVGDVLGLVIALLAVLAWRFELPFAWSTLVANLGWFLLLIVIWAGLAPILDTYNLRRAARLMTGPASGVAAVLVVSGVYLAIPYITPPLHTSRLTAASFVAAASLFVGGFRLGYALLLVQPTFRHRVLIVGAGWAGRTVAQALKEHAAAEYEVVGFIDDDPTKVGTFLEDLPVVGTHRDLQEILERQRVSELILAITRPGAINGALLEACVASHEQGIQVTPMPAVYERLTGRVPVEHAGDALHMILPADRVGGRGYVVIKRGMDIVLGLVGSLIGILLVPIVGPSIVLDSRGPVLYRQRRVGRGGRLFTLFKFRTMVPDAEAEGPRWARERDDRVTRVGRVLRRLHLDELPQAINILRGDMSFIGPRPERPEFVAHLEKQIPFYRARHAVRPGVTGWAQVNYEYGDSVEDALIKLQYDLYYIKHANLWLDLVILARTVGHVLRFAGR